MAGERGYQEAQSVQCAPAGTIEMRGLVTDVDIASLESAQAWLTGLSQYVTEKLVGEAAAKLALGRTGSKDGSDPGEMQVIFGSFDGATEVAQKHDQFRQAVISAYEALARDLKETAEGTGRIIENYKTVEERNRASVADITRLLSNDAPASSTSARSTGYATTPADAAPATATTGPASTGTTPDADKGGF